MTIRKHMTLSVVAAVVGMTTAVTTMPVHADEAGAFIGGVIAAKVGDNMRRRTEAQEAQAQPVQQAAPVHTAPAQKSAEQRLAELDTLAAGGYISPQEYQTKRQAILDSL